MIFLLYPILNKDPIWAKLEQLNSSITVNPPNSLWWNLRGTCHSETSASLASPFSMAGGVGAPGWTLHCRHFDPARWERRRCTALLSKQHLQRDKEEGAGKPIISEEILRRGVVYPWGPPWVEEDSVLPPCLLDLLWECSHWHMSLSSKQTCFPISGSVKAALGPWRGLTVGSS